MERETTEQLYATSHFLLYTQLLLRAPVGTICHLTDVHCTIRFLPSMSILFRIWFTMFSHLLIAPS